MRQDVLVKIDKKDKEFEKKYETDAFRNYDPNSDPLVLPVEYDAKSGLDFKFEDLAQQSKELRSTQRMIERELQMNLNGNLELMQNFIIQVWNRLTRKQKKEMNDLLQTEASQLRSIKTTVGNLYGASLHEARNVHNFCQHRDAALEYLVTQRPTQITALTESAGDYRILKARLNSLPRSSPEFYRTRAILSECEQQTFKKFMDVDTNFYIENLANSVTLKVDTVKKFLNHGTLFARKLYATYTIAEDVVTRVGPGATLVREGMQNDSVISDIMTGVKTALLHGYDLETSFNNGSFLSQARQELPQLAQGSKSHHYLDFMNGLLRSGEQTRVLEKYGGK